MLHCTVAGVIECFVSGWTGPNFHQAGLRWVVGVSHTVIYYTKAVVLDCMQSVVVMVLISKQLKSWYNTIQSSTSECSSRASCAHLANCLCAIILCTVFICAWPPCSTAQLWVMTSLYCVASRWNEVDWTALKIAELSCTKLSCTEEHCTAKLCSVLDGNVLSRKKKVTLLFICLLAIHEMLQSLFALHNIMLLQLYYRTSFGIDNMFTL